MLSNEEIHYFKTLLTNQLEELLENASHTVKELYGNEEKLTDIIDQGTLESIRRTSLRIKDRESRLIYKIITALKMIEKGIFGYCQACGNEIGLKRLMARPVTMHCIECKMKMEAQERLRGG